MKNKIIIFLMMFLCVQVCAQQRRSHSQQRRTTTSVKSNLQITKKIRRVGEDGFIWYELQQGNLCGAADIEGKNIIPIKFNRISYICRF